MNEAPSRMAPRSRRFLSRCRRLRRAVSPIQRRRYAKGRRVCASHGRKGPDTAESPPIAVRSAVVTVPFCLPHVSTQFSISIFSISAFFA